MEEAFAGTVKVIQRFDSALRLNVHMHTLALDGVYVKHADGEGITFLRLPSPTDDEVHEVAERTAKRVATILENRGRTLDGLSDRDDVEAALGACYEAAARTPKTRVVDARRLRPDERVAVVAGFHVHAGPSIDGRDRKRVERVCRYLTRPPIATERLTQVDDVLHYELKTVWRDGTRFVTLDPYDLLARVCAMVPPPRFHRVRFHGLLAPNSALREQVGASARPYVPPNDNTVPQPLQLPLFGKLFEEQQADISQARRKPWAWLLRHVFAVDVNVCPKCSEPMKWRQVGSTPTRSGTDWRVLVCGREDRRSATERRSGSSRCHFRRCVGVKERRFLRDLALVFASDDVHVCTSVEKKRRERASTVVEQSTAVSEYVQEHEFPRITRGNVIASMAKLWGYSNYAPNFFRAGCRIMEWNVQDAARYGDDGCIKKCRTGEFAKKLYA